MEIDGPWAVPTFNGIHGPNYGVALVPGWRRGFHLDRRWRGPRHRQGRSQYRLTQKLLAAFLARPYAQTQMANRATWPVTRQTPQPKSSRTRTSASSLNSSSRPGRDPWPPAILSSTLTSAAELQEVLAGNLSVSDAMNTAAQEANAALSNP